MPRKKSFESGTGLPCNISLPLTIRQLNEPDIMLTAGYDSKPFPEDGGILKWGYYISGPAINLTGAKRFYVWKNLYLNLEAKINASYSNVPIKDGSADVYNIVLQIDLLPGWDLNL